MTTMTAFPRVGLSWRHRIESIPLERVPGFALAGAMVTAGGILRVASMSTTAGWFGDTATLADRVAAQRVMVAAYVVSAALLWTLSRRAGMNRWPAALALAVYGLSPLAVHVNGLVAFDNLATPALLAAFVAAYSPRPRVSSVVVACACAAVAVVLAPALLALVPVLAWQIWRWSDPGSRRYAAALGGSLFALLCGVALLFTERPSMGGVLVRGATDRRLDLWFGLDTVFLVVAGVAALVALVVVAVLPSLRPIAVATLVAAAVAARPGSGVPVSAVAAMLPFGALSIAGMADEVWSYPSRWLRGALLAAACAAIVVGAPGWADHQRSLVRDDRADTLQAAERWVLDNVPADRRVVADDAVAADLAAAGFPRDQLLGFSALDRTGDRWQGYDVVVVRAPERPVSVAGGGVRAGDGVDPDVAAVVRRSTSLAAVGEDEQRVEVRRLAPAGSVAAATTEGHGVAAAIDAGTALAANPGLTLTPPARQALTTGQVDERLMTALVAVATAYRVELDRFPDDPAERGGADARRIVELRAASHDDALAIATLLDAQQVPYRPVHVDVRGDGALTVTYPPAALG
jgi:hypothetical protein